MKDFPYKTSFSFVIKPLVSEEKDKYLSIASLEKIKDFIPNINIKSNKDLLPIAFNACVPNRVNKNDDVIDTDTALAIYKNFLFKPIDVEHKRTNVVGVILTAGFSKFGTDDPLTEEQVKGTKEPFNITLGGVLWRITNGELVEFVEESSDPESENFLSISASWELGFEDYKLIALPDGQKNIDNYKTVDAKFKEHLRALGGDGLIDGMRIYRMPTEGVTPLGIGLTEKPAAEVKGIATEDTKTTAKIIEDLSDKLKVADKKLEEALKNLENSQNNTSQAQISNVNQEYNVMEIKTLADITDESLKQIKASVVSDFIKSEILKSNEKYVQEKSKVDSELSKASEEHKKLTEEYNKLQEALKTLQANVDNLEKEKKEREAIEKFNVRMASISEKFELDDEARAALVDEVKNIASDEAFEKWLSKAKVLLKGYAKKDVVQPPVSTTNDNQSNASVIDQAINNGEPDKNNNIPNSSQHTNLTVAQKYAAAFAKDGFEIKIGRR